MSDQHSLTTREVAPGLSLSELLKPGFATGIEATATTIEVRLALAEYRARYGPDHWRLFNTHGRA